MIIKNRIYFVIFFAAVIISYYHTLRIDAPNYDYKLKRHDSIISNTIEYPYKYRLLNPYMADLTFSFSKKFFSEKVSFLLAYSIQNILVFCFLFFGFSKFLGLWFDETGIIIGILFFVLLIPLSLTGYDTLGDMTTAGLMSLGFYFINTSKIGFLFPVIFIGTFNELQIIILILFYFFGTKSNLKNRKAWLNSGVMTLVFVSGYFIIYLLRGGQASNENVIWFFTKDSEFNLNHPGFIILWFFMIAPLLYFALKGFNSKPEFLKRSLKYVIPAFYLVAFFFVGRMREIDKALTIFVILIPLALFSFIPKNLKQHNNQKGVV